MSKRLPKILLGIVVVIMSILVFLLIYYALFFEFNGITVNTPTDQDIFQDGAAIEMELSNKVGRVQIEVLDEEGNLVSQAVAGVEKEAGDEIFEKFTAFIGFLQEPKTENGEIIVFPINEGKNSLETERIAIIFRK